MDGINLFKQFGNINLTSANGGMSFNDSDVSALSPAAVSTLQVARATIIPGSFCPSDFSAPPTNPTAYIKTNCPRSRGNYVGSVGPGDMYGPYSNSQPGPPVANVSITGYGVFYVTAGQNFDNPNLIAPATTRIEDIRDGTSKTVMFSEVTGTTISDPYATPGDILSTSMGGSLFSLYTVPNSNTADSIWTCAGGANGVGDTQNTAPCTPPPSFTTDAGLFAAARSRHPAGVNVTLADGSVHFVTDDITLTVWQSLGTRDGSLANVSSAGQPLEVPPPPDF
jgi:prepilin-type processing-associated H-X9-DG protein